jgi:hypothetical protein
MVRPGHRVYGPKETRILAFIRRGRGLGFTLDEIRALIDLGELICFPAFAVMSIWPPRRGAVSHQLIVTTTFPLARPLST